MIINPYRYGAPAGPTPSPVADSIVALLDFPLDGTRFRGWDYTGDNHFKTFGSVTWGAAQPGNGVSGFSSSNYIAKSGPTGPTGYDARSVSFWFKTNSTSSTWQVISCVGDDNVKGSLEFISIENGVIYLRCGQQRIAYYGSGYNDDAWHFCTLSKPANGQGDGTTFLSDVVCYVDGSAVSGTVEQDGVINLDGSASSYVGVSGPVVGLGYPFPGTIGQVIYADTAWGQTEHRYAMDYDGAGQGRAPEVLMNTVTWTAEQIYYSLIEDLLGMSSWRMNANSGMSSPDSGSGGYDQTLSPNSGGEWTGGTFDSGSDLFGSGSAFNFDGTSGYATGGGDGFNPNATNDYLCLAWVKGSNPSGDVYVVSQKDGGGGTGYVVSRIASNGQFYVQSHGGSWMTVGSAGEGINTSYWTLLAIHFRYNNSLHGKIFSTQGGVGNYVGGRTGAISINNVFGEVVIGANKAMTGNFASFLIGPVAIGNGFEFNQSDGEQLADLAAGNIPFTY